MKPPVEAPTSRHAAPGGSTPVRAERVGELDAAARDEPRALVDGDHDVLGHELAGLGRALAAASPRRTSPAITDAAARAREANSPRSASRVSRRTLAIGGRERYRGRKGAVP